MLLIKLHRIIAAQRMTIDETLEGGTLTGHSLAAPDAAAVKEFLKGDVIAGKQPRRKYFLRLAVVENHLVVEVKKHQRLIDVLKNPAMKMVQQAMGGIIEAVPIVGQSRHAVAQQRIVHILLPKEPGGIQISGIDDHNGKQCIHRIDILPGINPGRMNALFDQLIQHQQDNGIIQNQMHLIQ